MNKTKYVVLRHDRFREFVTKLTNINQKRADEMITEMGFDVVELQDGDRLVKFSDVKRALTRGLTS